MPGRPGLDPLPTGLAVRARAQDQRRLDRPVCLQPCGPAAVYAGQQRSDVHAVQDQSQLIAGVLVARDPSEAVGEHGEHGTPGKLSRIGNALYGPRWQSDLARDLGVADRTVRAWVAGDRRPAPGVWIDLERLVRERRGALDALLQPAVPH